jgi:2,4-dienoyl-CoA reductase-like NADH-dependent reductase (Old Yellow Enzyme family)
MDRSAYKIFAEGVIAGLTVPNRLVRSATWDPSILGSRQMTGDVLDLYRNLALGGVGLIITGGFPVYRERFPEEEMDKPVRLYADLRVNGLEKMAQVVRQASPGCKIIAQLEVGYLDSGPSSIPTPFSHEPVPFPLLHQRQDSFGGTPEKRSYIVREIVARARKWVGNFPILIKMNCTDNLVGGVDLENFPALAQEIVQAGVDAIEISGGMWDCLFRSEAELGFRPVPAPESHTRIRKPEQQSYFLKFAEQLDLPVPIILVGGNRDIERLEAILQGGKVDFIALCRPLIREPDLPNRWRAGIGKRLPECVSCNSCIYAMINHRIEEDIPYLGFFDRVFSPETPFALSEGEKDSVFR